MSTPVQTPVQRLPANAVLIVVDVQQAFNNPRWGTRNNPRAEQHIASLIESWRRTDRPIIHIQHRNPNEGSLFNPDGPGFPFKPEAVPLEGEPVLFKSVNSAFIGTDLEDRLRAAGATTVVVVGITTDHCVSTTTRMAGNLGFQAIIVADATATFERTGHDGRHYSADEMHDTALTSLNGEFAMVVTTAAVLESL